MGYVRLTWLAVLLLVATVGPAACAVAPEPAPARQPLSPAVQAPVQPPPTASSADESVLVGSVIKVTDGDTITVQLSSGPISVRFDSSGAPGKNRPARLEAPFCQEDYRAA